MALSHEKELNLAPAHTKFMQFVFCSAQNCSPPAELAMPKHAQFAEKSSHVLLAGLLEGHAHPLWNDRQSATACAVDVKDKTTITVRELAKNFISSKDLNVPRYIQ